MELMQAVNERRSIRNYKEGIGITEDQLKELIACAQLAPSWKNSQTGRYYVALSEEAKAKVYAALPEFNSNSSKNASALIVTTFEMKRAGFDREGNPDNELGDQWGAYDLGLQNENLLLRARDMGYDTFVMGIRDSRAIREIFDIPESQQVVAVIAVGVRENDGVMPKRKDIESILKVL